MAKNLIFCFVLIICSLSVFAVKLKYPLRSYCDDNYKYDINTAGGKVMVVSESFFRNRLQPSLNGLPVNTDNEEEDYEVDFDEELENYEDNELLLRGGETEVYDVHGQKLQLSDMSIWEEDTEDVLVDEADFGDLNSLVVDGVTEVVHPTHERVESERLTGDFNLVDGEGSFDDVDAREAEEDVLGVQDSEVEEIEREVFESDDQ